MAECAFPLCKRHAEKNGYCIGHRIYAKKNESEDKKKDTELPREVKKDKLKIDNTKKSRTASLKKTGSVK